jgi:hypothetical protein
MTEYAARVPAAIHPRVPPNVVRPALFFLIVIFLRVTCLMLFLENQPSYIRPRMLARKHASSLTASPEIPFSGRSPGNSKFLPKCNEVLAQIQRLNGVASGEQACLIRRSSDRLFPGANSNFNMPIGRSRSVSAPRFSVGH